VLGVIHRFIGKGFYLTGPPIGFSRFKRRGCRASPVRGKCEGIPHLFGTNRRENKEEKESEVKNGIGFAKDWLEGVLRWG
jgi:hypothetical protein